MAFDNSSCKGEKGEPIPSRMVFSGHHVGYGVWGDHNGEITWDALSKLSKAMPHAASQVEDLHVAGCYSAGSLQRGLYKEIFPEVKTIWAYSGSAPGSYSGAIPHQRAWEKATRGNGSDIYGAAEDLVERGVRKADNIEAAAVDQEYLIDVRPLSTLRSLVRGGEDTFQNYFTGGAVVENSQHGPLRDYYNNVQALLQHPNIPSEDRSQLEERRDQTIRCLYYQSHIAHKFAEAYEGQIQSGYEALGLSVPQLAEMSREEALAAIAEYREKLAATEDPPQAAQALLPTLNGLWNLDPQFIPSTWI